MAANRWRLKPTPREALRIMQAGNERFAKGRATHANSEAERLILAGSENQGDYAYATVITCSDSRVPVELIFDAGVMDIFVVRVAGNVSTPTTIASMEYGLSHVYTPLLIFLGHSQCGALTAAVRKFREGGPAGRKNLPDLLSKIMPAVQKAHAIYGDISDEDLIIKAIEENVWLGIEELLRKSPTVCNFVLSGKVKILGAIYDIPTGAVEWLPEARVDQILSRVAASG